MCVLNHTSPIHLLPHFTSVNRVKLKERGRVNSERERDERPKCETELEGETKEERRITRGRGSGLKKAERE